MVHNEVECGQLRALQTEVDVAFGTLVVAYARPRQRLRPLVRTITQALLDNELTR
jgi:hypothetical protein